MWQFNRAATNGWDTTEVAIFFRGENMMIQIFQEDNQKNYGHNRPT